MLDVLLLLSITTGAVQCASAGEAAAGGLTQEVLDARYAPALGEWPQESVTSAWEKLTQPLRGLGEHVSLAAYFAADGTVDLLVVRGEDEAQAARICEALGPLDAYRWPLAATRPFRQCGSVSVAKLADQFELRVSPTTVLAKSGGPIPLTVVLENVSQIEQRLLMPVDGRLDDNLGIGLRVEGQRIPAQLLPPPSPVPRRFVAVPATLGPGQEVEGALDLAGYSLPDGAILGQSPGEYVLHVYLLQGGGGSGMWTGVVWSEPIHVAIRTNEPTAP